MRVCQYQPERRARSPGSATISRPMPRRGASSVVRLPVGHARTGSGHGEPPTRALKVDRSIAEGPRGGPRVQRPPRAPGSRRCRRAAARAAPRSPCTGCRTPSTTTSTSTSCGRPTPSSTAAPGSRTPSRAASTVTGAHPAPDNYYFQDVYPLTDAAGNRTSGACSCRSRRCRPSCCCRSWRCSGCSPTRRRSRSCLGALGVGHAWWMLGGLRLRVVGPRPSSTVIFATGTVWWWAAAVGSTWYLAHLVAAEPRDARGGRRAPPRSGGPPTRRRARRSDRDADQHRRRACRGGSLPRGASGRPPGRSTARRCSPGCCSGLSVTARLPLVFAAPWFIFVGGGGLAPAPHGLDRRGRRSCRSPRCSLYTFAHHRLVHAPGLRLPVPARGQRLPDARLPPRVVRRGRPLHPAEPRDHVRRAARRRCPDIKPNTLGFGDPVPLCIAPGRAALAVRHRLPAARCPIDIGTSILLSAPGPAAGAARLPAAAARRGSRSAPRLAVRDHRAVQPRALQPGLGAVGLPVLARLHAVPAADGRAGRRARRTGGCASWRSSLLVAGAAVNLWGVAWGQILGW